MCHCDNSPQFPTGNHFYFVGFVYWNINLLSGCISVVLLELIKLFCLSYLEQNLLTGLDQCSSTRIDQVFLPILPMNLFGLRVYLTICILSREFLRLYNFIITKFLEFSDSYIKLFYQLPCWLNEKNCKHFPVLLPSVSTTMLFLECFLLNFSCKSLHVLGI